MSHDFLTRVIPLLSQYGYAVILPIAVVEGPAMAMVAGAMVAGGQFNAMAACALLVAADLVGDAVYYALGRFGHAPLLRQIAKRFSVRLEHMHRLEQHFREHDWKILMIGKTQALGSIVLYMAGASRMPFWRYLALNVAATLPKVILFETVGYFLGRSILQSTRYIDYATVILFGLALVLLVLYWLLRRWLGRDMVEDEDTDVAE